MASPFAAPRAPPAHASLGAGTAPAAAGAAAAPLRSNVAGEVRAWYLGRQRHCGQLLRMEERCDDVLQVIGTLQADASLTLAQQANLAEVRQECESLKARAGEQRLRFLQPDGSGGLQPGARVGVFGLENAGKSTFLSAWAAHEKKFLPADDERCTGTSCRVHHRPAPRAESDGGLPPPSQSRFSATVTFRSKEQFLPLVHDLCEQLHMAHDDVSSMSAAVQGLLQARVDACQASSSVALDELRNIVANWSSIARVISSDASATSTKSVHSDSPREFAALIRPYIVLTGSFPRAVLHVDIYADLLGLDEGIELLDLPGINSPHAEVNRVTFDSLGSLDLVLFLHDASVPQLTGDGQLPLQTLIAHGRKVLFLATGIDKPVCLNPTVDDQTGELKAHTPLRVVRSVRKLFPTLPLSDIHAVSSYWYCDNASLDPKVHSHSMVAALRDELQTGAFAADGMARVIDRIRRWCDVDLAMDDERHVSALVESDRQLWLRLRSVVQSLHVVDAGATLAIKDLTVLLSGFNSSDPNCLYSQLVASLNQPYGNEQHEGEKDGQRVDNLLAFIHTVMEHNFSYERVRRSLDLLVNQSSIGQPFCLADLEKQLRRGAFQAVDSAIDARLQSEHNSMVDGMLQFYVDAYCDATWKNGCINNLLLDATEETRSSREQLRALLQAAVNKARSAGTPWISKVKEILHLIVGVAPSDKARINYVRSTVELPNCTHKASRAGSFLGLANRAWQVEQLFFLPWVVRGLEVDKAPFTSSSFVVDKSRDWDPLVSAEQAAAICMEVYQRLQSAVLHLTEMIAHVVSSQRMLHASRKTCLTTLQFELLTEQEGAGKWISIRSALMSAPTPILFPASAASKADGEQRRRTAHALLRLMEIGADV